MTQLTQHNAGVPAFLQHFMAKTSLNTAALGGVTSGVSVHSINIKGSRWRLQSPAGQEQVANTLALDVIIVDANPHLSKVFYASTYNPVDTEFKAPDCWSDNGKTPDANAANKQAVSCAACPHNVWGSKTTPTGSQTRACGDSKKVAVVLADNPTGAVYLLKIPAASLKNWFSYVQMLTERGAPLPAIVTQLSFDSSADYPKIMFTATGWIAEPQAIAVAKVLDTEEVRKVVGIKAEVAQPVELPPAAPQPAMMFGREVPVETPIVEKPKAVRKPKETPAAAVQTAPDQADSFLDDLIGKALSV